MTHPPEPGYVLAGLFFAVMGAYALYSEEAGMPSVLGMWMTQKKEHPAQYWLVVILLLLFAAISFLKAFDRAVI